MSMVQAVCPKCVQILQVDVETLPDAYTCPHCGAQLTHQLNGATVTFFPMVEQQQEQEDVKALLQKAEEEQDPKKKHALLEEALALNPDSYQANMALLLLGRLYERDKHPGDFRVIKSYLLNVFEAPGDHPAEEALSMLQELMEHPQVLRTLNLAPDEQLFWDEYLGNLSDMYLSIFIRSRSGVSKLAFGIPRSSKDIARTCGAIVGRMMLQIAEEDRLDALQRQRIRQALRRTYARSFPGYETLLNDA